MSNRPRVPIWLFFVLFTVSGFAGLIYESIWSHYLKLFLGHAAYAQTLVLGLFMGGMAIGAALAARCGERLRNTLLGYSVAELFVGLLALAFHGLFSFLTTWALDDVLAGLESTILITCVKWGIAGLLILPSSILLGATFPLMSTGIMRAYGDHSGKCLPILYFTNSLGAALGVLASGFLLIEMVGLPGTIFSAGLLNILLALVVWLLAKKLSSSPGDVRPAPEASASQSFSLQGVLYLAAFATGVTSFMYEIAWIRMLSLAIGASTHSFEVMLSAFILGIALGGLALSFLRPWIKDSARTLGWVIAAKGLLALLAVALYPALLDLCQWFIQGLGRTENSYSLFLLGSYGASALMMVPTAFCAGMTLPLATQALLARGGKESSIGLAYAANTLGAIVGTVVATHLGMELLGVKGVTGAGVLVEWSVALLLLARLPSLSRARLRIAASAGVLMLMAFSSLIQLDSLKMASGIFRVGQYADASAATVKWHKDGKTATISVVESRGIVQIRTNGKTDAAVNMNANGAPSVDEYTMVLLGLLGHMHRPDARDVANIGFGSGLTTHTLLGHPEVRRVDTIEIERVMIEGAAAFRPRNELAFTDPRSALHIEDAKTFLAARRGQYDIIVSEPSNPWVSGVATLFSEEFYGRMKRHLRKDGVLVQWLQVYETKPYIVASILKALGTHFSDYAVYHSGGGDMIIVASVDGRTGRITGDPFRFPRWAQQLGSLGYSRVDQLHAMRIGGRDSLEPLVQSFPVRANSDFFPVVDLNAPRERFMHSNASEFLELARQPAPLIALIESETLPSFADIDGGLPAASSPDADGSPVQRLAIARATLRAMRTSDLPDQNLPAAIRESLMFLRIGRSSCPPGVAEYWISAAWSAARPLTGTVDAAEIGAALDMLAASACGQSLVGADRLRFDLLRAVAARQSDRMGKLADALLSTGERFDTATAQTILQISVSAKLAEARFESAAQLIATGRKVGVWPDTLHTRLLEAHLASKQGRDSALRGTRR